MNISKHFQKGMNIQNSVLNKIQSIIESSKAYILNPATSLILKGIILNYIKVLEDEGKKVGISYGEYKRIILEELIREINKTFLDNSNGVLEHLLLEIGEVIKRNYEYVDRIKVKVEERLIIGTKNPFTNLSFETGTIIHPILGVPYIPASSLKGSFRSYVELKYGKSLENICGLEIENIFGESGEKGALALITITDAYPLGFETSLVEPEVTTPIYAREIREDKASPTPIIYPVVARKTIFVFYVAFRKDLKLECINKLLEWIRELTIEGIGAKTLVGFGIMSAEVET